MTPNAELIAMRISIYRQQTLPTWVALKNSTRQALNPELDLR
jgi:hypothetical protein